MTSWFPCKVDLEAFCGWFFMLKIFTFHTILCPSEMSAWKKSPALIWIRGSSEAKTKHSIILLFSFSQKVVSFLSDRSESNLVFVDRNLMCCSTSTGTRKDSKRKKRIPREAPDTPWTVLCWLDAICAGRMPKLTVILAPENLMSGTVQTLFRTPLFRANCYPDHPRPSDNHPDNLQPPKRHLAEMLQNLDQEKCWFSGKSARTIVSILADINSFLGGAIRF